jgi:hypothetical protein
MAIGVNERAVIGAMMSTAQRSPRALLALEERMTPNRQS